jgi:hypothetical protein
MPVPVPVARIEVELPETGKGAVLVLGAVLKGTLKGMPVPVPLARTEVVLWAGNGGTVELVAKREVEGLETPVLKITGEVPVPTIEPEPATAVVLCAGKGPVEDSAFLVVE